MCHNNNKMKIMLISKISKSLLKKKKNQEWWLVMCMSIDRQSALSLLIILTSFKGEQKAANIIPFSIFFKIFINFVIIQQNALQLQPSYISNTHHQAVLHPNPSHTVVQQQLVCTSFSELLLQSSQFLP